ncbi:MAG: ATP-binding cassette domain-containing protein [Ilumatobacter sp.]|nr:ATP-binding cassette domain-containing protein [Ilumatobacter sp.]
MTAIVRLAGVTKRYRRGREVVTAVDDVSLDLPPGSMIALVGPSGSGKTTLLNLICGGDEPDDGTIEGPLDTADWSQLAIVPQTIGLLPELTMGENVGMPIRLGAPAATDVAEVMERLGIGALADRPPEETSLGEQQRAAVARALVTAPGLLIADEPTSHQDEANTDRVGEALADVVVSGSCVLVATHDSRLLARCDLVFHMRDGVVTGANGVTRAGSG